MTPVAVLRSILLFVAAGLCEIGGGWLVWQWRRSGQSFAVGAAGGLVLFLYGILPTLQPARFSRVYAAYGGVFIVLSLAWGYWIDREAPDRFDLIGAAICGLGVLVMMYWPRG